MALHGFINLFLILSLATLWALLPTDLLAISVQWIQNRILSVSGFEGCNVNACDVLIVCENVIHYSLYIDRQDLFFTATSILS